MEPDKREEPFAESAPPARPERFEPQEGVGRRWLVLTASALGAFAAAVMGTSVNVALPSLVEAFDAPFPTVQWVVLAYLLATSALLPVIGRLADMFGKKTIFLSGFAMFVLGSFLCGLAPGVWTLVALRSLQGIGSAVLTAVGLAIVTDVFPSAERGRALGFNGAVLSSGIVVGPTLGGFLVDGLGWQWVFFAGVPVGLAGTLLAMRFVPAYPRGPKQSFDVAGAALLFLALLCLSLALTLGQRLSFDAPLVLALFGISAVSFGVFVLVEARLPQPLVELALFRSPTLSVGLTAGLATFVSIAGTIFLMPFYLENVLGYPPRQVGLLMSVVPIVLVVAAPIAGLLADRYGERLISVWGLALILVGYLLVATLDQSTSATGYVLRFLPLGLGMGTFQTPNNSAIMGSVARNRSGVAGGLLVLTRALGQTAGIAVLGSLWAARVVVHAGLAVGAEATEAPSTAQVAAIRDMMVAVVAMIAAALALCLWDLWRENRSGLPPEPAE